MRAALHRDVCNEAMRVGSIRATDLIWFGRSRSHADVRGCAEIDDLMQHADAEAFPDPDRFDPRRFLDTKVNTFSWIPFGGGTRRCVGAAFANMEMDVVLRTVLRQFTIEPTNRAQERYHARGVAYTPKKGGRITVHRRTP